MNSWKKLTMAAGLLLLLQQSVKAQTTLSAGDIVFTGYDGTPIAGTAADIFSFVLMTPISASTVIYFTERGYQGGTTWQLSGSTEGTISWTVGSALPAGTEVKIAGLGGSAATVNAVANGTVAQVAGGNAVTGLSLSNAGDQIIAFQGASGDPTNIAATMIAGISWHLNCGTTSDAGWNGSGCTYGPQSSAMPPGLTGGTSAFLAGTALSTPNNSQGKFNCTGTPFSTLSAMRTAIMTKSNWTFSSETISVITLPAACGTFYSSCSNPVITAQPSNRTICVNGNTTYSTSATGATGYQWQVNTGSGFNNISNGGVYSNATTATLTITGATSGMSGYQYRCFTSNGSCNTTTNAATLTISNISTATYSQTNVACFGGANGAASITPSGGISPYTYSWSPAGGTSSIATGLSAGTYTVTVTDNISCQATRNFTITQPASALNGSTVVTNIACFGGSNGAINLTPSGGTPGYTFAWTGGATTEDRTGLVAGSYSVTITDANGCTKVVNTSLTQPAAAVSASQSVTNVTCYGASNGAIDITASGGTAPYTYDWGGGVTSQDRTNVPAGSYAVTITDANGCTSVVNVTVSQPSFSAGSNNFSLPSSNTTVVSTANNYHFTSGSCTLLSNVLASGASPVSGTVTTKVWIESSVPSVNNVPFVKRHYEVTPSTNPTTSTGTVTLYFTQAEFDELNAQPNNGLDLPKNATDAFGKANLRIGKYSGTSGDGNGLPASYTGSAIVINPDDDKIVWNATAAVWEVTFDVSGFSGFVVQTFPYLLPVKFAYVNVLEQRGQAKIDWATATEQNSKEFVIQYSSNGENWISIATVQARGNSTTTQRYSYVHGAAQTGKNYYRILQRDVDGAVVYSDVKLLQIGRAQQSFVVMNAAVANGTLQVNLWKTTTVHLYAADGKLIWAKPMTAGMQQLDVSALAKGVYWLKADLQTEKIVLQ